MHVGSDHRKEKRGCCESDEAACARGRAQHVRRSLRHYPATRQRLPITIVLMAHGIGPELVVNSPVCKIHIQMRVHRIGVRCVGTSSNPGETQP